MEYATGKHFKELPFPNLLGSESFTCNETNETYTYDGIKTLGNKNPGLVLWHYLTKKDNEIWICDRITSAWFSDEFLESISDKELQMLIDGIQNEMTDLNLTYPENPNMVKLVHPSCVIDLSKPYKTLV